jgi:hypothetical protein
LKIEEAMTEALVRHCPKCKAGAYCESCRQLALNKLFICSVCERIWGETSSLSSTFVEKILTLPTVQQDDIV